MQVSASQFGNIQPVVVEELSEEQAKAVHANFENKMIARQDSGKEIVVQAHPVTDEKGIEGKLKSYWKKGTVWVSNHPVRAVGIALLVGYAIGKSTSSSEKKSRRSEDTSAMSGLAGLLPMARKTKRKTYRPKKKSSVKSRKRAK